MASMFRGIAFFVFLLSGTITWACAICAPSDVQNTFMARLAAADGVLLAARQPDSLLARPLQAVRGGLPAAPVAVAGWQTGAVQQPAGPQDALLLFYNAGSQTWWAAGSLDARRAAWVSEALGWTGPAPVGEAALARSRFFAKHLEDPQPLIAQAAFEEVSSQPYPVLRLVAQGVDASQLQTWVQRGDLRHRRPLYALLWGFVGGERAAALAQNLAQPDAPDARSRSAAELSALTAAVLEVRGPTGLTWVERTYLTSTAASDAEVQAVLLALSTLGNDGKKLGVDELTRAYARFIQRNPQRAGFVASDLAAWGRWEFAEAFAAILRSGQPQVFSSRYAMVFYLLRNPRPEARALIDALKAERLI